MIGSSIMDEKKNPTLDGKPKDAKDQVYMLCSLGFDQFEIYKLSTNKIIK